MGTSKGYILPTKKNWTDAKRAATQLSKENNLNNRIKLANKYASAMKQDSATSSSSAIRVISQIIGLSQSIANRGVEQTLKDLNKEYLLDKTPEEVLDFLISEYSEYGNTKDIYLALDALTITLKDLDINTIEELGNISIEVLLKEILINYIELNFKFRFEEQINKKSPNKAHEIIDSMSGYIKNKLREELNISNLENIDFNNLNSNKIIEDKIIEAYDIFKELYGEE